MGIRGPQPRPRRPAGQGIDGPRSVEEVASSAPRGVCPVCGAEFDPSRYQIVVSALGGASFDRVECADGALAARRVQDELLARRRRNRP
jgi:hypothetical protein